MSRWEPDDINNLCVLLDPLNSYKWIDADCSQRHAYVCQQGTSLSVAVKCKRRYIALHGNPISEQWDVACLMGSHSVICHPIQVNVPRLTPAKQAGTRFTYPGGMEGWVDLVDLIAPRPEVEPATFRSRVRRSTTAPSRQPIMHRTVGLTAYIGLLGNRLLDKQAIRVSGYRDILRLSWGVGYHRNIY